MKRNITTTHLEAFKMSMKCFGNAFNLMHYQQREPPNKEVFLPLSNSSCKNTHPENHHARLIKEKPPYDTSAATHLPITLTSQTDISTPTSPELRPTVALLYM